MSHCENCGTVQRPQVVRSPVPVMRGEMIYQERIAILVGMLTKTGVSATDKFLDAREVFDDWDWADMICVPPRLDSATPANKSESFTGLSSAPLGVSAAVAVPVSASTLMVPLKPQLSPEEKKNY